MEDVLDRGSAKSKFETDVGKKTFLLVKKLQGKWKDECLFFIVDLVIMGIGKKDEVMTLGKHIRELRKQAQMTQEQMAEALGIHAASISKWENEATSPDISILPSLARLLHVSMDELFQFKQHLSKQEAEEIGLSLLRNFKEIDMGEALNICKEEMRAYPNDIELKYYIGRNLWQCMAYAKEEETLQELLDYAQTCLSYCIQYGNQEQKETACAWLSNIYTITGKSEEALRVLDQIHYPVVDVSTLKASVYLHDKAYAKAQKIYDDNLLKSLLEARMILLSSMICLRSQKQYEQALLYFDKCYAMLNIFELDEVMIVEYENAAYCYLQIGKLQESETMLIHCLENIIKTPVYRQFPNMEVIQRTPLQNKQEQVANFVKGLQENCAYQVLLQRPAVQNAMEDVVKFIHRQ